VESLAQLLGLEGMGLDLREDGLGNEVRGYFYLAVCGMSPEVVLNSG
jgi:hypothetical protein